MNTKCKNCDKEFVNNKNGTRAFCSDACRMAFKRSQPERQVEQKQPEQVVVKQPEQNGLWIPKAEKCKCHGCGENCQEMVCICHLCIEKGITHKSLGLDKICPVFVKEYGK